MKYYSYCGCSMMGCLVELIYASSRWTNKGYKNLFRSRKDCLTREVWWCQASNRICSGKWFFILAWEITENAIALWSQECLEIQKQANIFLILGNEVDGVMQSTLDLVDRVVYIPMKWIKESLNVWQSSAIFMWELNGSRI